MKLLLFLTAFIFHFTCLMSQHATEESIRTFSADFCSKRPGIFSGDIKEIRPMRLGQMDCRQVLFHDTAYLLLRTDLPVPLVLSYSRECSLDEMLLCPGSQWWLRAMEDSPPFSPDTECLSGPAYKIFTGEPLLSTAWGQFVNNSGNCGPTSDSLICYNMFCPPSPDCACGFCTAGCVAVAMAQIIRYWQYPASAQGFGWDYCNMPDMILSHSAFCESAEAIARLISDCGVYAGVQYCHGTGCASSSSISSARTAFVNQMGYLSSANIRYRSACSGSVWEHFIRQETDAGRPVYYRGEDGSGGHAFVCDGYDPQLPYLFHFNMGWNGMGNAYYAIPGSGSDALPYPYDMQMITGLQPPGDHEPLCGTEVLVGEMLRTTDPAQYFAPQADRITTAVQSPVKLVAGDHADYTARSIILLSKGFHAGTGSCFRAHIIPCAICENESGRDPDPGIIHTRSRLPVSYLNHQHEMLVFPNPADKIVYFSGTISSACEVRLFDVRGRLCWFGTSDDLLDVSDLPAGVYAITFSDENAVQSRHLIIQHP
jgi:hypothetical protein